MKFFPFKKIILTTPHSKDITIEKLKAFTEPPINIPFYRRNLKEHKAFHGKFENEKFEIQRTINYRNSYLPYVKGRFENSNPTKVYLTFRPHKLVIFITIIWFIPIFGTFIAALVTSFYDSEIIPLILLMGIMLCFGIGLVGVSFSNEFEKAKKKLVEILDAKER